GPNKEVPPSPDEPKDIMIPKARFDEVNQNYKAAKEQLDKFLDAQRQAEEDAAKQRGEYEQLYTAAQQEAGKHKETADKSTARVQELEGILNGILETRLAAIPESMRDLIPDNLTSEQKLAWIDKAASKGVFGPGKTPEKPVGGPTNPPQDSNRKSPQQALQEAAERARKSGRSEDRVHYAQLKRELEQNRD
ncbi:hypothetical protein, partial [Paenibacillus sp. 1P03SA]|uniref:hypothetical protein n=1 Tax=Paenibacillus sp. 1P03SA TaxID=3132294 RepID=UPI0039A00874